MNRKVLAALLVLALATVVAAPTVLAQASSAPAQHGGGEASLKIPDPFRVLIILLFSLIGIAGSYGVAWFGIRINTFANSRTAFASLRGEAFPVYAIPLKAGMSIGMLLISVELFLMLCILLFIPGDYAGPCFIGFAIG